MTARSVSSSAWLGRLEDCMGNKVLPWSFKTPDVHEAIWFMENYDYICLHRTAGFFFVVRRDACDAGIKKLRIHDLLSLSSSGLDSDPDEQSWW